MRFRWLSIFPLIYALVFVALAWGVVEADFLNSFVRGQLILVRLLAIAGCFVAASAFSRGDHLRRAWLWLGAATVLVLLRDLLRLPPFELPPSGTGGSAWIISGLGILSNLGLLTGTWLLARAWKLAALSLPGGPRGMVIVAIFAAILALVVAGPGAVQHARELADGQWGSLILFVSAVVDILSLCLLAPLFLTALALRGGLFAWPWALVTASILSWLLYDAAAALTLPLFSTTLSSGQIFQVPVSEIFRGLAENYLCVAGLAQYFVVRKVRSAAG